METVITPIIDSLSELILNAENDVLIVSPWIKLQVFEKLFSGNYHKKINLRSLTVADNFADKTSDLDVIPFLSNKKSITTDIRLIKKLHAKIYISDSKTALITSANFTKSGLEDNIEAGVLLEGNEAEKITKEANKWFSIAKSVNENSWYVKMKQFIEKQAASGNLKVIRIDKLPEELDGNSIVTKKSEAHNPVLIEAKKPNSQELIANLVQALNSNEKVNHDKTLRIRKELDDYVNVYKEGARNSGSHPEMGRMILPQTRKILNFLKNNIRELTPDLLYDFVENLRQYTRSTVLRNVRDKKFSSYMAFSSLLFSCKGDLNSYDLTQGEYPAICRELDGILSQKYSYNKDRRMWQKK
jgi:hypothetical protein